MKPKSLTLRQLAAQHCAWLKQMGWVGQTTPLEQLALITSEIGEAANECRGAKPTDQFGRELADIILRTIGLANECGIDIEAHLIAKIEANKGRVPREDRIK